MHACYKPRHGASSRPTCANVTLQRTLHVHMMVKKSPVWPRRAMYMAFHTRSCVGCGELQSGAERWHGFVCVQTHHGRSLFSRASSKTLPTGGFPHHAEKAKTVHHLAWAFEVEGRPYVLVFELTQW